MDGQDSNILVALLCSTNYKRKKIKFRVVAQDLNISYTHCTFFSRTLNLNSNNSVSKPYKRNNCKAYKLDIEDFYGGSVSFNLRNVSMKPPLSITNCYDNCLFFRTFEAK